jgi:hypothetical protein
MLPSLWSRLVRGMLPASRSQRSRQRWPLRVEPLEDRCLLSSYTPAGLPVEISNPDPLPNAPPGFSGTDVAAEPYVAVNPTSPKNIVARPAERKSR